MKIFLIYILSECYWSFCEKKFVLDLFIFNQMSEQTGEKNRLQACTFIWLHLSDTFTSQNTINNWYVEPNPHPTFFPTSFSIICYTWLYVTIWRNVCCYFRFITTLTVYCITVCIHHTNTHTLSYLGHHNNEHAGYSSKQQSRGTRLLSADPIHCKAANQVWRNLNST